MKLKHTISAFVVLLICVTFAQAQSDRTFVSAHGADNSDCGSADLPCRSFSMALAKTNAGGEVIALDSGLYDNSNIAISKSATLAAVPGAHVELFNTSPSSIGIQVNASSSDTVVLRNLYLSRKSSSSSTFGIEIASVGTLHIENCVVSGFTEGISFDLNTSAQATIQDTIVRDCFNGIIVGSSAGTLKVSIDHCRLQGSVGDGLDIVSHARVTVRDSVASGNGRGFVVGGGDLNIENCEASNNGDGVVASGGTTAGTVTASNCIVTNNSQTGFTQSGTGVFQSLGNNVVRRNGTNTSGTITVIPGT